MLYVKVAEHKPDHCTVTFAPRPRSIDSVASKAVGQVCGITLPRGLYFHLLCWMYSIGNLVGGWEIGQRRTH